MPAPLYRRSFLRLLGLLTAVGSASLLSCAASTYHVTPQANLLMADEQGRPLFPVPP